MSGASEGPEGWGQRVTVGLSIMEIHSDFDGAVFSDMVGTETLYKWVEE